MRCKIKTISKQMSYTGSSIFEKIIDEFDIDEPLIDTDDFSIIESYSEGELFEFSDEVKLSYNEDIQNDSSSKNTSTVISFNKSNPKEIILTRNGDVSSVMVFKQGERNLCVYNTEFMPFEICIYTKSITNNLLDYGFIEIVYLIEIKGACAQKTVLKMEIEKL